MGYDIAKELQVKASTRNVFLDSEPGEEVVRRRLGELVHYAKQEGAAIGIGHPHPHTINVLREMLPTLEEQGIKLVHASEIVE